MNRLASITCFYGSICFSCGHHFPFFCDDIDQVASAVNETEGVIVIPTFSGILAPYWRSDLTASITGLTLKSTRHHICRAAVEAICFQTRQVIL